MQFLTTFTILLTAVTTVLAQGRADKIKAGLAIVGNQQWDVHHAHKKAAPRDEAGRVQPGNDRRLMRNSKNINNALAGTVTGVKRVRRSLLEAHGLELLGRDETHEYFARALPEEEIFERDFDFDDLD
ncbi:hypothetical protein BKA70DRAFT_675038 [Coprinopsis sp. MPI-PUGE-AT-0042]|nr:hypothetical protein BKA70DRAFT_675038 [Coprinopsis sp. MPI-PUGE-AT-0042]